MRNQTKGPAAYVTADRAGRNVEELGQVIDKTETTASSSESPAVVIIAQRHFLTITHARIVCQNAGIGGKHE